MTKQSDKRDEVVEALRRDNDPGRLPMKQPREQKSLEGVTSEELQRLRAVLLDVRGYFAINEFDSDTLTWIDEGLDIVDTLT